MQIAKKHGMPVPIQDTVPTVEEKCALSKLLLDLGNTSFFICLFVCDTYACIAITCRCALGNLIVII
jgi:hypothetical protein